MATDRELIEKVKHGESKAYGQLFQKYYGQIYAICLAILKNPQDAEELAQDVFILAYVRLDQLREPGKFFPWLKKIARNRSKNHMQKAGLRLVPLDSASSHKAPDAPDERILRQELMDSIMGAIEALPTRDREVVQARIDGLSYREISDRSGISAEVAMNRLSRARKHLAEHMKGLLSAIFSLPKILSPKKIISGGITAAKAGTAAKVTVGIAGILVAGFIGLQLGTRLTDNYPSETGNSQSETEISQSPSSRTETGQKSIQRVISQSAVNDWNVEDEKDIQQFLAWLDSLEADAVEIHPNSANSAHNILPEESQDHSKMYYDETYDTFVGITKKIILVKKQMAPIDEELKRLTGEWKRIVRDPENLTEEEKRLILEMKEYSRPMWEERQELGRHLHSLVNELFNEIEAAAPGAVQAESKDTPKGTVDYVRIDYERIRSALGALPEKTDSYLAEFFAGFANISR
jgi:RNA polymerase sigma-70 factor (ECF subfamily)